MLLAELGVELTECDSGNMPLNTLLYCPSIHLPFMEILKIKKKKKLRFGKTLHSIDKETKAQRFNVTCSHLHSYLVEKPQRKCRFLYANLSRGGKWKGGRKKEKDTYEH